MEEKSQEMGEHHKAKAAIQKDINDIKVAISERKAAIVSLVFFLLCLGYTVRAGKCQNCHYPFTAVCL